MPTDPELALSGSTKHGELVTGPDVSQMGRLAGRGVFWTLGQNAIKFSVSIGTTAILSRILSPQDYGLWGMVGTLSAFLILFLDVGLSWATIQRADLTKRQMDNLFWLNALVGVLLWMISVICGPLLARFYGQPVLATITLVSGSTLFIGGLAVQPSALLRRQMDFKILAFKEICGVAVGGVVALSLAVLGYRYWALVWQSVSVQLGMLVYLFCATGYRPGRFRYGEGTLPLLKFGGGIAAAGLAVYFARSFDAVLIGKMWGATEIGLYSRSVFLATLSNVLVAGVFATVTVPALTALQKDRQRMAAAYRAAVRVFCLIACPLGAIIVVTAPEIVRIIYGQAWLRTVPMVRLRAIGDLLVPVFGSYGWLLVATGQSREYFRIGLAVAVAMVMSFMLGIHWGGTGVAAASGIATLLLTLPPLWRAHRVTGIPFTPTLRAIWPAIFLTSMMLIFGCGTEYCSTELGRSWGVLLISKLIAMSIAALIALAASTNLREAVTQLSDRVRNWASK